jgi:hypothetical protein
MSYLGNIQTLGCTNGTLWISSNNGSTWSNPTSYTIGGMFRICSMSGDGQYQLADQDSSGGLTYLSSDYGNNWNVINSISATFSNSISETGQYQVIVGSIYYSYSTDYGVTWTTISTTLRLYSVSISGDANYIEYVDSPGYVYLSNNSSSSSTYLQLGEATTTYPGIVTTSGQTFAGSKTFTGTITGTTGTFTGTVSGTTGTFTKTVTAAAFNSTSDYRVKENIQDLNLNIYNVNPLRPVNYYNNRLSKLDIGFIAHEVQEYYPFLVSGVKDGEETQSLNYNGLIGILVKEIQELKQRVKQLEDDSKNK